MLRTLRVLSICVNTVDIIDMGSWKIETLELLWGVCCVWRRVTEKECNGEIRKCGDGEGEV